MIKIVDMINMERWIEELEMNKMKHKMKLLQINMLKKE